MSYRLNQLAVGNFFLHFTTSHGNAEVQETLYKVIERIQIDEVCEQFTLRCLGYIKESYNQNFRAQDHVFTTDQNNLKFAPITVEAAIDWLDSRKVAETIRMEMEKAKQVYNEAEKKAVQFAEHFGRLDVIEQVEYDNTYRKETYPDDEIQS